MVERTVNVDDRNYYFDINKNSKSASFYPGVSFYIKFKDGSAVLIPPENIKSTLSGNWFKVNGVKYFIEDNESLSSLKYGYFVHSRFDRLHQLDHELGLIDRSRIQNDLKQAWTEYLYRHIEYSDQNITEKGNSFIVNFSCGKYFFEIKLCSINRLVTENNIRKMNNLPYLPFNPNMDKFNSFYLYAQGKVIYEQMSLFDNHLTKEGAHVIVNKAVTEVTHIMNYYTDRYYNNDYRFINLEYR